VWEKNGTFNDIFVHLYSLHASLNTVRYAYFCEKHDSGKRPSQEKMTTVVYVINVTNLKC
jgi:hypothetical protein